jgi:hypothetical protein
MPQLLNEDTRTAGIYYRLVSVKKATSRAYHLDEGANGPVKYRG